MVELVAASQPGVAVGFAFLELAEPSIATGLERLIARGAERVVVAPLLLFAAGHAKCDIPLEIARAVDAYGFFNVCQAAHLGLHECLFDLSKQRFSEATVGLEPLPDGNTVLLLIGRGNRDETALAEIKEYAAAHCRQCGLEPLAPAFVAMAEPSVEDEFERLSASSLQRVIVQPHLLFQGEILDRLRVRVAEMERSEQQWILTGHLGPSPLLVRAILDRFTEALTA